MLIDVSIAAWKQRGGRTSNFNFLKAAIASQRRQWNWGRNGEWNYRYSISYRTMLVVLIRWRYRVLRFDCRCCAHPRACNFETVLASAASECPSTPKADMVQHGCDVRLVQCVDGSGLARRIFTSQSLVGAAMCSAC